MSNESDSIWSVVKFDEQGLIPAVVQDVKTNEILMLAYMNRESLGKTLETGESHFYSRSRQEIWHKGGTSGHVQKVHSVAIGCYGNSLVIKAEQVGSGACHTGYYSCFYRSLKPGETKLSITGTKTFDANEVYGKK